MKQYIPISLRLLFLCAGMLTCTILPAQDPVWSDEFDGTQIDRSVWTYGTGGDGNGNGELQYYTAASENSYIESGNLVIEARKENYEGKQFTSARLETIGRFSFKYGSLEASIKLPDLANGLWPAFWMMGSDFGQVGWPHCGETDILEAGAKSAIDGGTANRTAIAATHWWHDEGTWSNWLQADHAEDTTLTTNFYEGYHTFRLDWTPTEMVISVDGVPHFTQDITDPNLSEFHNPNFILLNLAVGGYNFVEITDPAQITAPFPAKMYVDYVRLYANEHTQIYEAEEYARRNNFGVFTETTLVDENLNFGDPNNNIFLWNNMVSVNDTPAEGGAVLSYEVAPGDWWGMGIHSTDQNMKYYANGYLHFKCKTTSTGNITIGIASTAAAGGSVVLAAGGEEYGLVRDGQWHNVAIPLNKFSNVDFQTINQVFTASGTAPADTFGIAFDDIYWSESVPLPAPEFGNFGVYTETPANKDAGEFSFGVSGDLFLWENTLEALPTTAAEGNAALSFTSTGAGWFGMGLTGRTAFNLSAFDNPNGYFHFSMKTTSTVDFRVGMKSGTVNDIGQKWIWFRSGQDPYGFARDGQWHDITIPVSELSDVVDMLQVLQLFQLLGTSEISDIAVDNIYFSGGGEATDPGTGGTAVNRPPTAVITASATGGPAPLVVDFDASKSTDVNGDALTYQWNFGDGSTATGMTAQHTFTANGNYTVTLTVADSASTSSAEQYIFVNNTYGNIKSQKRGLGYGSHSEADMAAISQGISWWYNWFHQPDAQVQDMYQNYDVEFVPMAWNGGFNEQAMRDWLLAHPEAEYVLGWNEPNFLEQANMTPSQAAAEWPRLEAIADEFNLKIVSPAMNFCGNCVTENGTTYTDPIEYLDDFFAACTDCRVDAISIHAYMGHVSAVEWYVGLFKKYGKPIWMTEFANWENDPTLDEQKRYLVQAVDYMENDPDVERYAWFTGRHTGPPYIGLLDQQSGVLTELGQIYVNMPVHDPAYYHAVPGLIEAENYTVMSGVRPEPTEDENGFLNLSEIEAGDWIDFNVNAASGGTFDVDFRVASDSLGGTLNVLVDGVQQGSVNFGVTGGWQSWINVSTTVSIPAGNHVIRLEATQGVMNLNYFSVSPGGSQNAAPVAAFSASNPSGQVPHAVTFDASASSDPDSDPLSYSWDFGDGANGSGQTVSHTYNTAGSYTAVLTVSDGSLTDTEQTVITVTGTTGGNENLALNKPSSSSSTEGPYVAASGNDGNASSRWASEYSTTAWMMVDLQQSYSISRVVLNWERASAESYYVMVSDINSTPDPNSPDWTVISTQTGMADAARIDDLTGLSGSGRYIAMYGFNKLHPWGYSVWEFEVYGDTGTPPANEAPVADAGSDQTLASTATTATLDGSGSSDPDSGPSVLSYSWTQTAGPAVAIADASAATTSVSGLQAGNTYAFQLAVDDGAYNSTSAVSISVDAAPAGCGTSNLALSQPAAASSYEGPFTAGSAVDGDGGTRWGSGFTDNEWIRVDLGATYTVCEVVLTWETAYGSAYEIRLGATTDLASSAVIASVSNGDGGTDIVSTDQSASGRYIWMQGVTRALPYGYSLYQMEVYGGVATGTRMAPAPAPVNVALFPNPAEGQLTVFAEGYQAGDQIEVLTLLGEQLISEPLTAREQTLDVQRLQPGVYIFRLTGSQEKTIRFIKR
ncbi:MAG: glycosyl hydrolase [Cyclobacteriaceae bacterium]